jgi:hypothetical protein
MLQELITALLDAVNKKEMNGFILKAIADVENISERMGLLVRPL